MSKLSIIVPVYWNSDTLMLLYEDMKEKILHKLEDYEIVFVDDGSGDNSWEIMNQIRDMEEQEQGQEQGFSLFGLLGDGNSSSEDAARDAGDAEQPEFQELYDY